MRRVIPIENGKMKANLADYFNAVSSAPSMGKQIDKMSSQPFTRRISLSTGAPPCLTAKPTSTQVIPHGRANDVLGVSKVVVIGSSPHTEELIGPVVLNITVDSYPCSDPTPGNIGTSYQ